MSDKPIEVRANFGELLDRYSVFAKEVAERTKRGAEKIHAWTEQQYAKTMATWTKQAEVKVTTKVIDEPRSIRIQVETGAPYPYVDWGTPAHDIVAKNAPMLVFRWGGPGSYHAKTTPNVIGSQPGGAFGKMVAFKRVRHPGTKPRNFTKLITQDARTQALDFMFAAIQEAADQKWAGMV